MSPPEADRGYTMAVRETEQRFDMGYTVKCLVNFKRGGNPNPFEFVMNANGTFQDGTGRPLIVKRYKREEYAKHCAALAA